MILDNKTVVNGIAYDWSSIEFKFGVGSVNENSELVQITNIGYGETRESKLNYGRGSQPVSKGFGNVSVQGKMKISMNEMRRLINASANGKVQNLPAFDILISYKPGVGDAIIVSDTLNGCTIDSTNFDLNQNDMDIEIEVNLNPFNITYGNASTFAI